MAKPVLYKAMLNVNKNAGLFLREKFLAGEWVFFSFLVLFFASTDESGMKLFQSHYQ